MPLLKMFLATSISAGICISLNNLLTNLHPEATWLFLFAKLAIIFLVGGLCYFILAILLKLSIAKQVASKLLSRFK